MTWSSSKLLQRRQPQGLPGRQAATGIATHPAPATSSPTTLPPCPQIPLSDIFKLEVGGMKSIDDYMAVLSKKGRWNYKDRQKK